LSGECGVARKEGRPVEAIALMGEAFASPMRLELPDLLAQAPRSVHELAQLSALSKPNVSQHLHALRAAGMVTPHESARVSYRDVWTPAQRAAGVAFTLYDLRHTFSSRLLAGGIRRSKSPHGWGHSLRVGGRDLTNTTTRVYVHATGEHREAALTELTTLISETSP
jgi:DNA-binding transcriptional ArsR family regulator